MNKWRRIETAPEGEAFLAWWQPELLPEFDGPIVARRKGGVIVLDWDSAVVESCTHWMSLPKGPK